MAVVLIQHLDPTHESALSILLSRTTLMPVVEARHRLKVKPGHVYIIPPNKKMGISRGVLRVMTRDADHRLPSAVDFFLHELAVDFGARAIGIILSGTGMDGTRGIQEIKSAGGVTFAQDESSAKYSGMPVSAGSTGCVDHVMPPEAMAAELVRLEKEQRMGEGTGGEPEIPAAEVDYFRQICSLVRAYSGVDFTQYKPSTIRRRVSRRMAIQKKQTLKEYVGFLRKNSGEVEALFQDILIFVSGFFRDPKMFDVLKKKVFPSLCKNRRQDLPIRIWVAGCSTGEEVYSLAIALLEFMEKQAEHYDIQVFGSDINEKILARARAGVYPDSIAEDVSPERLSRYFSKTAAGYRISKAIRDMCIFARQDVTRDPPFSNIDLVSCRNVMIYFDVALQKKVIPIFHYALRPQGFLVLGMAESIGGYSELFSIVDARHRVYTRMASALRMAVFPSGLTGGSAPASSVQHVVSRQVAEPMLSEVRKQADAIILSKFCPSGVVVNSSMQILQFRGQTGPFLENTPGDASLNLLKMARQGLAVELRPLISRAVKLKRPVEEVGVQVRENGRVLSVDLKVIPFSVPPGSELFFLILFTEKSSKALPAVRKGRVSHASPLERELEQLRDEISASKLSLQTIIEEQEASNEELRAASEEALSSNEELQSTNEELETAKEELQSTNEELTTLNEELQNRNLELHQLSDDLINLFSSVDIPIVILGADLRIRRFTPKARKVLNIIPGDVGRPISDLKSNLIIDDLRGMIDDVLESLTTGEHEVQDLEGRWHVLRIRPYKTMDNRIDGVVLTLLDIDALKRSLAEAQEARQFAEAVIATVREPLLVLDSGLNVKMVNRSFCEFFRTRSQDAENKSIYELGNGQWDLPALRELLEKLLPTRSPFEGFRVEHEFPEIGKKELLLNARSMTAPGHQNQWILLAMEDITPSK